MKNNSLFLIFTLCAHFNNFIQSKDSNNKNIKTITYETKMIKENVEKKITKQHDSKKFIKIETYADMQTSHLNRPNIEIKQERFTLPQQKRDNYYNSPNMNAWANESYSEFQQKGGTINLENQSYTISSSFSKNPFKKPLPGPR